MDECDRCPTCGRERPAGSPGGPCPLCRVREVLGGRGAGTNAAPGGGPADRAGPGRYQLLGEIARGGSVVVLRARDAALGRDLAMVVRPAPQGDRPERVRRFLDGARALSRLQHQGIPPVYDLGVLPDNRAYLAVRLVAGRTLAELLAGRADPGDDLPRLLKVFEQVCQAVAYAHAHGLTHAGLNPSAVIVGAFGEVQVSDWGAADVLTPGAEDDGGGDGGDGTTAYTAPERARGGGGERPDARADVFGLGSILAEILTGRPAYAGETPEEVAREATIGDPAGAHARLAGCAADADLIALAWACLAAEPGDRPRDAGPVAEAVAAYHAGLPARLRASERARAEAGEAAGFPHDRAGGAWREADERQTRWLAAVAAGSFALVVGLALGGRVETWRGRHAAAAGPGGRAVEVAGAGAVGKAPRPHAEAEPPAAPRAEVVLSVTDEECAAEEADRRLIGLTLDARAIGEDDPDGTARDLAYAAAFRGYGLEVDTLTPAAAGARVKTRPAAVALNLAAALDDWAAVRRGRGDWGGANRLNEIARVADPDPWRDRLRATLGEPDRALSLAGLLALARATPAADVPAVGSDLLGRALADLGDLPAAEMVLRRAQQRHPSDAWVNHDLAEVLARLGRDGEAIRYDTAARSLRPETAHPLGHALERAGEPDGAVAVFGDLVRRRPGAARHRVCLGRALKEAGRAGEADSALDAAVAAYREAVRLKPDDAGAHDGLGRALVARGGGPLADAGAVAEFREAVRLRPDFAGAHLDLGVALMDQGQLDAAVVAFRAAVLVRPGFAEARRRLGTALVAGGRYEAAAAEFREAIRLRPEDVSAHDDLGSALGAGGRIDEAVAAYREAIRRRPDLARIHNRLGVMLFERKHDPAAAAAEFRESVRLRPDWAEAHFNLGNALKAEGRAAEALTETREALRCKPDYAEAHVNVGLLLRGDGRTDEAIAAYREANRLRPDLAEAHLCLANALASRGDLAAAAGAYREAIRLKPGDAEARRDLETVQTLQRKTDGALDRVGAKPAAATRKPL